MDGTGHIGLPAILCDLKKCSPVLHLCDLLTTFGLRHSCLDLNDIVLISDEIIAVMVRDILLFSFLPVQFLRIVISDLVRVLFIIDQEESSQGVFPRIAGSQTCG